MQFESLFFKRNSVKLLFQETSINLFCWWRLAGSNRWPPACKAGALPAELNPHIVEIKSTTFAFYASTKCFTVALFLLRPIKPASLGFNGDPKGPFFEVVGQNGLEPSTSRLSVVCSSQLSYWPISTSHFLGTSSSVPSKVNNALSHYY